MKSRNFISSILILISLISFGQTQVSQNYPFNKASKIELIVFENYQPFNDTLSILICPGILKIDGEIDSSKIIEREELNIIEIQELQKVINFQKTNCSENVYRKKRCSESGYGVIFYDSFGAVLEHFEKCFNCMQFQVSSAKMNLGLMCPDKYFEFENFFNKNGLKVIRYRDE